MTKYVFVSLLILLFPFFSWGTTSDAKSDNVNRLAGVIYAEATNEDYHGKSLVATVIWMRSDGDPLKLSKTISIPKQFATPQFGEGEQWDECVKLAREMYSGTFQPQVVILGTGETIYPDHFFHGKAPWWATGRIWRKVGKLKFLKLGNYKKPK